MSFGALLTYPDGTPYFIENTLPMSLLYKRDFSYDANNIIDIVLDERSVIPNLYFIRFNECYSWGRQSNINDTRIITVGANKGATVSGRIYCFGVVSQPVPKWGVAIWNSQGECIMTNETVVLKGLGKTNASGTLGEPWYLNEIIPGRVAIIPGRCGVVTWKLPVAGGWITAAELYSSGCYFNGQSSEVSSRSEIRSGILGGSMVIHGATNYRPHYINCDLYD